MINSRDNNSKLCRLKKIYDMLEYITKPKKSERLNSAVNSPYKIKMPLRRPIQIKRLHVINNKKEKSNEKLNKDFIFDIVNRKHLNRRVILKGNFNTNVINSSVLSQIGEKKSEIIQTDRDYKSIIQKLSSLPKEKLHRKENNPCKSILEYRIKNHKKKRNVKDVNKSNSPIFKTTKNINFPNIYQNKERNIKDYLDVSSNQKQKGNFNIKRYYCILNNLRIKLHGNIFLTRKSKEKESVKNNKRLIEIKNLKNNLKENSSSSLDKSFRNISKYEQICNFSNQMIRDSLSERNMKNIFKNINK